MYAYEIYLRRASQGVHLMRMHLMGGHLMGIHLSEAYILHAYILGRLLDFLIW